MTSEGDAPAPLSPSELGTKEYWDGLYARELDNHAACPSDTGTDWFSETEASTKMAELAEEDDEAGGEKKQRAALLDLGCGNGSLLRSFRTEGWKGRALGVDYSPHSIALSRRVGEADAVEWAVWDVVAGSLDVVLTNEQVMGWDVVLDKGTFDAVSLARPPASDESGGEEIAPRPCAAYVDRVRRLTRPRGGIFIITSCNWTEDELIRWFAGRVPRGSQGGGDDEDEARFEVAGTARYRSFSFGGHKGQAVSTVCFRRL